MIKKHYTINYLFDRLKVKFFEWKNPKAPWLTQESIKLMKHLILPTDYGLEFGSGRSTKWLASKCQKLISIEHNQLWYDNVRNELSNLKNVEYHFKNLNPDNIAESDYLKIIAGLNDCSVDFILNDGKIRDYVAFMSIPKLKPGGLLILDNAERYIPNELKIPESIGSNPTLNPRWDDFVKATMKWRKIWTDNGISSTLIMIKN